MFRFFRQLRVALSQTAASSAEGRWADFGYVYVICDRQCCRGSKMVRYI